MKKFIAIILIFLIIYFLLCPNENTYKVVSIIDGDTIVVLSMEKKEIKIRLAEIDCPEKNQPYGPQAKQVLTNKLLNKQIKVVILKKDRYNRSICKIYLNNHYINQEMIEEGLAWHYTQYSHSKELKNSEDNAKKNRIGLWKDKNPIPPWEFRHDPQKYQRND